MMSSTVPHPRYRPLGPPQVLIPIAVVVWLVAAVGNGCIVGFVLFAFGFGGRWERIEQVGLGEAVLCCSLAQLSVSFGVAGGLVNSIWRRHLWILALATVGLALFVLVLGFLWWSRQH
jgi:hypothetical protein